MSSRMKRTVNTTLAVTMVIFLSKAFGLVRDIIVANYFATGWEHDAYSAAYTFFYFPVLLFNSCITSTLIPLYADTRAKKGRRVADRFASNSIGLFAVLSLVVGLIMMAVSEPMVGLIFQGFSPEAKALTAHLSRIMMPSLVFVVVSIVMSSLLNANERYLSAQLTGFPLSVAVIVAAVGFSPKYGIQAIAWGVFAAGILQMLIQVPALSKSIHYRLRMNVHDARFKRMLVLAVPSMLSMAVNELNHMIDKSLASGLNVGDLSAMEYAYRLITFAIGVLAVPIITVMFSKLSKRAAEGDRRGLTGILTESVETLFLILLPFTAVGCALSTDIIRLVYEGGKFGEQSVAITSGVFLFYMLGVIGFGLRDAYNRAFHALQDTRTPLFVSIGTVALNITLNVVLSRVMGVNGLALATTISCAVGAVVLVILLHKKLKHIGMRRTAVELGKMVLAGALCLALAIAMDRFIPAANGKGMLLLRMVAITGASFALYFGVLIATKTRQLKSVRNMLRRK